MSLDDHIKRRLENHRSEVDTDALWAALEPEVKRRKWGGFWMIPSLIGGIGISLISLLGISDTIDLANNAKNKMGTVLSLNNTRNSAALEIMECSFLHEEIEQNPQALLSDLESKKEINNAIPSISIEKKTTNIVPLTKKLENIIPTVPTEIQVEENPSVKKQISTQNSVIFLGDVYKPMEFYSIPTHKDLSHIKPLGEAENPLEKLDMMPSVNHGEEELSSIKEIVKIPKWKVSLGLDYTYAISDKILDGVNSNYALYRNYTEKHKRTYSVFPNISLRHKTGLMVRTGIKYTKIKELFRYTPSKYPNRTSPTALPDLGFTNTNSLLAIAPLADKEETNTYEFMDIPVLLGFRTKEHSGVSFLFEAGISANIFLKTEGYILEAEGRYMRLSNEFPFSMFKDKVGLSALGRINSNYAFNNHFAVNAGIGYTYQLSSVTKQSYILTQRFTIVGFNMGMTYTF